MSACTQCGEANSERARFCQACGAPLGATVTAAREVRKTVSVLFADITGSTALGERLDPEPLRGVLSRYFDAMRAVLERHGGTLEKFIGDAIVGVFGVPQLHEDDALRAVRAAAEMRESLAGLNQELERSWGVQLQVRMGINTGEVVAGDAAMLMSDALNVAARLEQMAAPGEIVMGQETYQLVKDAVTAEALPMLNVKGKQAGVKAFRLMAVAPGQGTIRRHLDSKLVGRAQELRQLEQTFERCASEQLAYLFTILGTAGAGKTRLLEQFLKTAGRATVLRGRCLSYGVGVTFWPIKEMVVQAAHLSDSDSLEASREKVRALFGPSADADRVTATILSVIGAVDAPATPVEVPWAIRKMLEELAKREPLIIVFEDLHWGEPTLLDLVEYIAEWTRDVPILCICLARLELLDRRPNWSGGKLNASTILLQPLDQTDCRELIANLLGRSDLGEMTGRILDAAEGNPLFVEEMLRMMMEDGRLRQKDGQWVPREMDLSRLTLPRTIRALLTARLDQLPDEERQVIETSSVVGQVFDRGAVIELSSQASRPRVAQDLLSLVHRDLLKPDRSTMAAEEAFRFRHILIRDVAYDSVTKLRRAELHEAFAGWLERIAGEHVTEYQEILAYHLKEAFRYRAELGPTDEHARSLGVRAGEKFAAAGQRAYAMGDAPAAAGLLDQASMLLPSDHPGRVDALIELPAALMAVGRFAQCRQVVTETIAHARAVGDQRLLWHSMLHESELLLQVSPEGAAQEARRRAAAAIHAFEQLDDTRGLAGAWSTLAGYHLGNCQCGATVEAAERAMAYAHRGSADRQEAIALSLLVAALLEGPTPCSVGLARCSQLLTETKRRGGADVSILFGMAGFEAMVGNFTSAREKMAEGKMILRDLGVSIRLAYVANVSGPVEMLAGAPEAAERELRESYALLTEMGEKYARSTIAALLGESLYRQDRLDDADAFSRESEALAASDDMLSQCLWRSVRAKILARRGEPDAGVALAREALVLIEGTDALNTHAAILLALAQAHQAGGQMEKAARTTRQAIRLYEQKGNVVAASNIRKERKELIPASIGDVGGRGVDADGEPGRAQT